MPSEWLDSLRARVDAVLHADPQDPLPERLQYMFAPRHRVRFRQAERSFNRLTASGDSAELDTAITLMNAAIRNTPSDHSDLPGYLHQLGVAHRMRFEHTGLAGEIDEAIRLARQAVELTPPDHPDPPRFIANFGHTRLDHPDLARHLGGLSVALAVRFEHAGQVSDLDEAIAVARHGVHTARHVQTYLPQVLSTLASTLQSRFERFGDLADLDEAIQVNRKAIIETTRRAEMLPATMDLSADLRRQLGPKANLAGFDKVTAAMRRAIDDDAAAAAAELATTMSNLATALRLRFERVGDFADLEEAVRLSRSAVDTTHQNPIALGANLSTLGGVLRDRFERLRDPQDLDEAIATMRRVVDGTPPDHPMLRTYLSNLSNLLQTRFEHDGRADDLDEAITVARRVIDSAPGEDPNSSLYLTVLSGALLNRSQHPAHAPDLDEAIAALRRVVDATPDGTIDLSTYLFNLGFALRTRFKSTNAETDLREAAGLWTRAARTQSAPAQTRMQAAEAAAQANARLEGLPAAAEAYHEAMELLPLLAWHGLGEADRRFQLETAASSLARDSAACAIATGDLRLAISHVDQGRGVVWAQRLDSRTDLAGLERAQPDLANRLRDCRAVLNQPTSTDSERHAGPHERGMG